MTLTQGDNAVKDLSRIQRICIRKTSQKISCKYKKRQQALHQECKTKKKGSPYAPGAFSTKAVPDVGFTKEAGDIALVFSITFVDGTKIRFCPRYR